eukprot:TRINITY_DN567_c0_g1_i1.p1 TRINITY_DN567_c0_g1~~TRINITY_DN567_c0_g1_i1.p1  ORF type:complete len:188 (+),score=31.42 TRINITY_DN567_c0_g1_i1:145-708(+)
MTEYRITVIGSGLVGKSALTVRFIQGNFVEKYDATIEDSYRRQTEIDGKACLLDVMDTAGQDEYSALRDQYMQTGEGFLVVYSITAKPTFDFVTKLRSSIMRMKNNQEDFPFVLVGNKKDLVNDRVISTEDGQNLATKYSAKFIETSAKLNENVEEAFFTLVREIDRYRKDHPTKTPKARRGVCSLI